MAKTMPRLIYCADGNPTFARIAVEVGWLYGARLPSTVYQPVYFADQDWKNPDRKSYMAALKTHRPAMATVLDWEQDEQLNVVLSWAKEAAELVTEAIIIIPKVPGGIPDVPCAINGRQIILGYSVPTSYGGSPLGLWEFRNRQVHLLGGSPHEQMRLSQYLNVVSADGNMAHQQAHRCRYWRLQRGCKGRWGQLSETGDLRTKGANSAAFKLSCENILAAWKSMQREM